MREYHWVICGRHLSLC